MKITIVLPPAIYRKITKRALEERRTIADVVQELMEIASKQELRRKHRNKYERKVG